MTVLSLCDGMSCGQIALKELKAKVDSYYASEIDKNAIKVTMDNFPHTIQIGDVTEITDRFLKVLPKIDLVLFGFPCRSLSRATTGTMYNNGLQGISGLFYPCNNILQWIKKYNNPDVKFLVENVDSAKKEDIKEISELLGVEPILINSALFSAQERKRNYWTNIPIPKLPKENKLVLQDILDSDVPEKYFYNNVDFTYHGKNKRVCATLNLKDYDMNKRVYNKKSKSPTLTSCRGGNLQKKVFDNGRCRKLTPNEYRKLQTIPDWYVMNVADSHIYNMCGDGWTIEVIKHILRGLRKVKK